MREVDDDELYGLIDEQIEKADAEYATKLVGYLISTVIEHVEESLSENADEKAKKRMLKVIGNGGSKGVTRNELTRKTQFIRRTMREEYLDDLIDSGEVIAKEILCGKKYTNLLYLADLAPEK